MNYWEESARRTKRLYREQSREDIRYIGDKKVRKIYKLTREVDRELSIYKTILDIEDGEDEKRTYKLDLHDG